MSSPARKRSLAQALFETLWHVARFARLRPAFAYIDNTFEALMPFLWVFLAAGFYRYTLVGTEASANMSPATIGVNMMVYALILGVFLCRPNRSIRLLCAGLSVSAAADITMGTISLFWGPLPMESARWTLFLYEIPAIWCLRRAFLKEPSDVQAGEIHS